MLFVNLWAGTGSGKSTGMAYIFSELKMRGINAEQVPEFAKDKVWEKNNKALSNQAYLFGKKYYRISRLEDEVDVAITDSPLMLSIIYNNDKHLGEAFNTAVARVAKSINSLNYFIRRVKPYNPKGRLQTESESDALSVKIAALLDDNGIAYKEFAGNKDGYDEIVNDILFHLGIKY